MSAAPKIRGWCPTPNQPMAAGDGLLLRLRPSLHRIDRQQADRLCELAIGYGDHTVTLTNRGGLQLRGVCESDLKRVQAECGAAGLLGPADAGPAVITTPDWIDGDSNSRLGRLLEQRSSELGPLPGKFCFVVDLGPERLLSAVLADLRVERAHSGGLLVRAQGCERGRRVDESTVWSAICQWTAWFTERCSDQLRRLHHVVASHKPPAAWQQARPVAAAKPLPGPRPLGPLVCAPFGVFNASVLRETLAESGACALRATPFRGVLLERGRAVSHPELISCGSDVRLLANACPGAPACPQASVPTRPLALAIVKRRAAVGAPPMSLHVSGCRKGCAHPRRADVVWVGHNGRLNLLLDALAHGEPIRSGVCPQEALAACTPVSGALDGS